MEGVERIEELVARLRQEYADDPNVHSIGWGTPTRAGEPRDEVAILFMVKEKHTSERLLEASGSRPIPREIEGFPTDVEADTLRPDNGATGERDEIIRDPLVGGVASSNAEEHNWLFNGYGTLGILCRDGDGNAMALSNWHVWADGGEAGDAIIQPGHPTASEHLTGVGTVAACGPLVGSIVQGEVPSPLSLGLYGGAAAAAIAAAASDEIDPTRRGQDATPVDPGERTLDETVSMAIEYPDLPWPGTPFRTRVEWTYARRTDGRLLSHEVEEEKINPQFLVGSMLELSRTSYRPGDPIDITAAIWDYQPRPCDGYHVVAHLIPEADPERAMRAVLQPVPCPDTVPDEPPKDDDGDVPGETVCVDFAEHEPGSRWLSPTTFQWLGIAVQGRRAELRAVDMFPAGGDGRSELHLGHEPMRLAHPPARRIVARVATWNRPITLVALDAAGNAVGSATTPDAQGTVHELEIAAELIAGAVLRGGGGEGALLEYCIEPLGGQAVEVSLPRLAAEAAASLPRFGNDPPAAAATRGQFRLRRCCFAGRTRVPATETPGRWDAYMTVQNVNHVPEGTDPVIAARVIGGHLLEASAEVLGCSAVLLSEYAFDVI